MGCEQISAVPELANGVRTFISGCIRPLVANSSCCADVKTVRRSGLLPRRSLPTILWAILFRPAHPESHHSEFPGFPGLLSN